ncbi:hypothetical protein HOE04_04395 [archaeon]|jgi:hypothetical protein|nr:hypothetical protein [archaeon]
MAKEKELSPYETLESLVDTNMSYSRGAEKAKELVPYQFATVKNAEELGEYELADKNKLDATASRANALGLEKSAKEAEKELKKFLTKENLEQILGDLPKEVLGASLFSYNPKSVNKDYGEANKAHKKAFALSTYLNVVEKEGNPGEEATKAVQGIVLEHYKDKYKDDEDLAEVLSIFVLSNEDVFMKRISRMEQEFKKEAVEAIGENVADYIVKSLPKDGRMQLGSMLVNAKRQLDSMKKSKEE